MSTTKRSRSVNVGCGLLNGMINALPFELHIPGYQFCGPGTRLKQRLARGDVGINALDAACREHDIAYSHSKDLAERHIADKILAKKAKGRVIAKDSTLCEKAAATTVWAAMNAKRKMGMGIGIKTKTKTGTKKKKRILPTAKRGGMLPILPLLGVLGSLVGGAAGVVKAVNGNKAAQHQLLEMQRHNHAMEGRGLYLAPYKHGQGLTHTSKKRKKKRQKDGKDAYRCDN